MTKATEKRPTTKPAPTPPRQELPDEVLDHVAGGGNPPTATVESTGSIKTL